MDGINIFAVATTKRAAEGGASWHWVAKLGSWSERAYEHASRGALGSLWGIICFDLLASAEQSSGRWLKRVKTCPEIFRPPPLCEKHIPGGRSRSNGPSTQPKARFDAPQFASSPDHIPNHRRILKRKAVVHTLNAMRSMIWLAPLNLGLSYRDPASIYTPTDEKYPGVGSVTTRTPFGKVVMSTGGSYRGGL